MIRDGRINIQFSIEMNDLHVKNKQMQDFAKP